MQPKKALNTVRAACCQAIPISCSYNHARRNCAVFLDAMMRISTIPSSNFNLWISEQTGQTNTFLPLTAQSTAGNITHFSPMDISCRPQLSAHFQQDRVPQTRSSRAHIIVIDWHFYGVILYLSSLFDQYIIKASLPGEFSQPQGFYGNQCFANMSFVDIAPKLLHTANPYFKYISSVFFKLWFSFAH